MGTLSLFSLSLSRKIPHSMLLPLFLLSHHANTALWSLNGIASSSSSSSSPLKLIIISILLLSFTLFLLLLPPKPLSNTPSKSCLLLESFSPPPPLPYAPYSTVHCLTADRRCTAALAATSKILFSFAPLHLLCRRSMRPPEVHPPPLPHCSTMAVMHDLLPSNTSSSSMPNFGSANSILKNSSILQVDRLPKAPPTFFSDPVLSLADAATLFSDPALFGAEAIALTSDPTLSKTESADLFFGADGAILASYLFTGDGHLSTIFVRQLPVQRKRGCEEEEIPRKWGD